MLNTRSSHVSGTFEAASEAAGSTAANKKLANDNRNGTVRPAPLRLASPLHTPPSPPAAMIDAHQIKSQLFRSCVFSPPEGSHTVGSALSFPEAATTPLEPLRTMRSESSLTTSPEADTLHTPCIPPLRCHRLLSSDLVPISVALGHRASNDNTCSGSSWLAAAQSSSSATTAATTTTTAVTSSSSLASEGFRRLRRQRSERHGSISSVLAAPDVTSPSP